MAASSRRRSSRSSAERLEGGLRRLTLDEDLEEDTDIEEDKDDLEDRLLEIEEREEERDEDRELRELLPVPRLEGLEDLLVALYDRELAREEAPRRCCPDPPSRLPDLPPTP